MKGFTLSHLKGKARRHRVPAASLKQSHLSRGDDRGTKINTRNRPARTLGDTARNTSNTGGTIKFFLDPASDNTNHARVPPFSCHQQHGMARLHLRFRHRQRRAQHIAFHFLPALIHLIQFFRHGARFNRIFRKQKPQTQIRFRDAARGIDARAQHEAECMRAWRILLPRDIQKCRQANPPALAQHLQTLRHQGAIKTRERHDITNGRKRHNIEQREKIGFGPAREPTGAAEHTKRCRGRQESHRCSADMPQARWAIQAIGIDDGEYGRQRAFRLVVIQHHNIGAAISSSQSDTRRNATIHANNERSAGITKCCNCRRIRPITFLDAIRHVR